MLFVQWLLAHFYSQPPCTFGLSNIDLGLVCTWMGDSIGVSISADSPSDETLNRGPLALLLRQQYELSFGIDIVQFSFFFSLMRLLLIVKMMRVPLLMILMMQLLLLMIIMRRSQMMRTRITLT